MKEIISEEPAFREGNVELGHLKACSWINDIHIKLAMEFQVYYFNWIKAKQKNPTKNKQTKKNTSAFSGISDSIS